VLLHDDKEIDYNSHTKNTTLRQKAIEFHADSVKVTKWIKDIYESIFEFYFENPNIESA
jgi:hypothetical protein